MTIHEKAADARDPRTAVRRSNREVADDHWIRAALTAAPSGVLATMADDQPFVNPNLFVFVAEEHAIYLHTSARGRTRNNASESDRAAFTIFEMGRVVPAPVARDFTAEYASVVVFGRLTIIEDPAAVRVALTRWLTKYFPDLEVGRDFEDFSDLEAAGTTVYRLGIESWSAKRNRQPDDMPGARRWTAASLLDLPVRDTPLP